MSFLQGKASYVKPQGKANYIRPVIHCNEKEEIIKEYFCNIENYKNSKTFDETDLSFKKISPVKCINDAKKKQLEKLTFAYSNLFIEIEKIQSWKATIELECKQKSKKIDELNQIIESQKKVVLDLQMLNENLSSQLSQEIQQRVSVLEKFYFTKELCSVLEKKYLNLEDQFTKSKKIKQSLDVENVQKLEVLEDITKKFNTMTMECSEKISCLNDALTNERNNTVILKNLCEQQNVKAEKEHKSFIHLIEKYQEELKVVFKDLDNEKKQAEISEVLKKDLTLKITQLENCIEENSRKLKESERNLQLITNSKDETENNFKCEVAKVNDLNRKYKELEDTAEEQKNKFEIKYLDIEKRINCLKNAETELKQKLQETECKNESLIVQFEKMQNEKKCLEIEFLNIKQEKETSESKFMNDKKKFDDTVNQLNVEKNNLITLLENVKEELQKTIVVSENNAKLCLENEKTLLEVTNNYQAALLKVKELDIINEKYIEALQKVKNLEDDLRLKSDLLISKNKEIEEISILKEKYTECQNKSKELEKSLDFKSQEFLQLMEEKVKELTISNEKLSEALEKIIKLENDNKSKEEYLLIKESRIEELHAVEEKFILISKKVKELEDDICIKSELLRDQKKLIEDLNSTLRENETALEMKNSLEKDKIDIKICSECADLKNKIKDFDDLQSTLMQMQDELKNQTNRANTLLKMLNETEDNFDKMRVKKEKQIIELKNIIDCLQHDLMILKVDLSNSENVRAENDKMKNLIEEMKLKNDADLQRLNDENEKLRIKFEAPKNIKDISQTSVDGHTLEKIIEGNVLSTLSPENNGKMEVDFFKKSISAKNDSTLTAVTEKRKISWESGSSESDCLQIVFDKTLNNFTPEAKIKGFKKKIISVPANKLSLKKDNSTFHESAINSKVSEFPKDRKTNIKGSTSEIYMNNEFLKSTEPEHDFLRNSKDIQVENNPNTPLVRRRISINKASTPISERKFFKTPLRERGTKVPQFVKPWF